MLRGDLTTHRLTCTQLVRAGRSQWCETNNLLPGHKPLEPSDHLTDSAQEGVLVGGSRNDDSEIQLPDPRGLSEWLQMRKHELWRLCIASIMGYWRINKPTNPKHSFNDRCYSFPHQKLVHQLTLCSGHKRIRLRCSQGHFILITWYCVAPTVHLASGQEYWGRKQAWDSLPRPWHQSTGDHRCSLSVALGFRPPSGAEFWMGYLS